MNGYKAVIVVIIVKMLVKESVVKKRRWEILNSMILFKKLSSVIIL